MKKTGTADKNKNKKKIKLSDYMHAFLEEETGIGKEGRHLYQAIQLINWDFVYKGAGTWGLLNHEREEQQITIHGRNECRLEWDTHTKSRRICATHDQAKVHFYLKECNVGTIDGCSITLTPKGAHNVWMSFPNYGLEKIERELVVLKLDSLKEGWKQAHERAREDGVIN